MIGKGNETNIGQIRKKETSLIVLWNYNSKVPGLQSKTTTRNDKLITERQNKFASRCSGMRRDLLRIIPFGKDQHRIISLSILCFKTNHQYNRIN